MYGRYVPANCLYFVGTVPILTQKKKKKKKKKKNQFCHVSLFFQKISQ